jgi:hypothetical protein
LFEGFLGTMKLSDSLHPSITVVPQRFTVRTWHICQARCRTSRVPLTVFPCMPEVSDPAGSVDTSPKRYPRCGLPRVRSALAPRTSPISGLNTLPASSPVNASCLPLPINPHDSGPAWLARPSLPGTCTLHTVPAFPGADPNAGTHLLPEAAAQRRLEAVGCRPWFGVGSGTDTGISSREWPEAVNKRPPTPPTPLGLRSVCLTRRRTASAA